MDRVGLAADILLNRWPATTGKKHVADRKACLGVIEGLRKVDDAGKPSLRPQEADILAARNPFS